MCVCVCVCVCLHVGEERERRVLGFDRLLSMVTCVDFFECSYATDPGLTPTHRPEVCSPCS